MTLRVNLLEDPTFRNDLIGMAKGLLRGIADGVIKETIHEEGWLQKRVEKYFETHPVAYVAREVISEQLRDKSFVNDSYIAKLINDRIEIAVTAQINRLHTRYEGQIKEMVAAELRRRFNS